MFARVLVGDDLSLALEPVLACVGALRHLGTREVILVHALGIRHLDEMQHALAPLVEPRLRARRRAVEELGVLASLEIAPGIPAPEIVRAARERHASLVVLGAPASRSRELLLGSVAVQVLHRCDVPVLVCRTAAPDLREHVLYATDLTPAADRALGFVVQLVRAGAKRVTLVRARGAPADRAPLEHLATRLLLAGAGDVRIEMPQGSTAEEIVRIAGQGVTLVAMGASGRGSASALYLGSVSHAVARGSPVPVLLVPAEPSASPER